MIFVTVGTQLPFDRLIKALDQYFNKKSESVFAQTGYSRYQARNIKTQPFLSPTKTEEMFKQADFIIAHAGMGSILTALKYRKNIIVIPRKASLGEHRNEHQLATANWVKDLQGVTVADDEYHLVEVLKNFSESSFNSSLAPYAEPRLIEFLKSEIFA